MKKLTFYLLVFLISGSFSLTAQDIRSSISGFSLGLYGKYSNWMSNSYFVGELDDTEPNGIGVGFRMSYGILEKFGVYLGYSQSNFRQSDEFDKYSQQVLHGGVRVNFGATLKVIRPFLEAGIGQYSMKIDPIIFLDDIFETTYTLKMSGIGGEFGVGLQWFIIPNLAAEFAAFGRFGQFSTITLSGADYDPGEKTDFRFIGGQIGITYYLQ